MINKTSSRPLHAPLDEYVRQFEDLKRDARQLTEGLSDAQLNWSPAPGRWSMAQCLEHLNSVALECLGFDAGPETRLQSAVRFLLRLRVPIVIRS